ncbi:class I SAM-dependent methyltransferase [Altericista sp. CCNU0014]|uniref:class I SAM-dependent methyltransferase n=1 Tax=Altericista sp. CCNU0014 TaxID=3082949 RepID=UPI00384D082A
MKRTPEPDLMNGLEQAYAYARADFEEPHNYCIELLRQSLPNLPQTGTALDLGCGPADIAIRFARAFSDWSVDGLDGSPAMLHYGREAVQKAGLDGRVTLSEAYLPAGNAPRDRYGLIFSNSLLHHLADPKILWQSIHRWAKPDAAIFIMDLMRPDNAEVAARLVDRYAANELEVLRQDFYNSLLAAYSIDEVLVQLQQAQLEYLAVKLVSDRHFIVSGNYAGW